MAVEMGEKKTQFAVSTYETIMSWLENNSHLIEEEASAEGARKSVRFYDRVFHCDELPNSSARELLKEVCSYFGEELPEGMAGAMIEIGHILIGVVISEQYWGGKRIWLRMSITCWHR